MSHHPAIPTVPDKGLFREVMSQYPTGVSVITSLEGDAPIAMVVGSFTSVSLNPPLVAFLAGHSSNSYQRLKNTEYFAVNFLSAEQETLCRQLSSKTVADRWDGVSWSRSEMDLPILDGVLGHVQCRRISCQEAGDHDIVIGQVLHLVKGAEGMPLVFFQGRFQRFTAPLAVEAFD